MKGDSKKKPGVKSVKKSADTEAPRGDAMRAVTRPVRVQHLDAPPRITRPKSIHPRRLLPFVAEGQERPFHSLNTRAIIHRPREVGQDIQIVLNTPLTHTVGKPHSKQRR
jgi:hypothetical protein